MSKGTVIRWLRVSQNCSGVRAAQGFWLWMLCVSLRKACLKSTFWLKNERNMRVNMLGHVDDSQMEGKPSSRYCRLGKTSVATVRFSFTGSRFGSWANGSVPISNMSRPNMCHYVPYLHEFSIWFFVFTWVQCSRNVHATDSISNVCRYCSTSLHSTTAPEVKPAVKKKQLELHTQAYNR